MKKPDGVTAPHIRSILDALPAFAFAVEEDVRIVEFNAAAGALLDGNRISIIGKRAGEALHCVHSYEVPQGCGHAPACRECVIRNSVTFAFNGEKIDRKRAKIEICADGAATEIFAVITASPFVLDGEKLVLLLIEDISELITIQDIVPICMKCKKVKGGDEFWTALESYFKHSWGIDFSHGYCPECGEEEIQRLKAFADTYKRT